MSTLWQRLFVGNNFVNLAPQRASEIIGGTSNESQPFSLKFSAINLTTKLSDVHYQLRACFYDAKYSCFFGHPWRSTWINDTNAFLQTIFFHCPIKDSSIMMVVEVVQRSPDQYENEGAEKLVGWTVLRYYQSNRQLTDFSNKSNPNWFNANLHGGSAKLVYLLEEPMENSVEKVVLTGSLTVSMQTHRLLMRAIDFIPEYTIIGANEYVPGLEQPVKGSPLTNPVPKAPAVAFIDQLVIQINAQTVLIEEELCSSTNKERLLRENRWARESSSEQMAVIERRIRIGIHNGWTYISEPHVLHLTVGSTGSTHSLRRKAASTVKWNSKNPGSVLTLKSCVELSDLYSDPGLAIVFVLDFVVGLVTNMPNAPTESVAVCWGAWSPFTNGSGIEGMKQVEMQGGPGLNPDRVLCYRGAYVADSQSITNVPSCIARFKFELKDTYAKQERSSRKQSSTTVASHPLIPSAEPTETGDLSDDSDLDIDPTRTATPATPHSKNKMQVDGKSTTQELPSWLPSMKDVSAQLPHLPVAGFFSAVGIQSMPRQVLQTLEECQFAAIGDRHGNIPEMVDLASAINHPYPINADLNDTLTCNQILFQFMAMTRSPNNQNHDLPAHVFMTFHFFRFPELNTESLTLSPSEKYPGLRILRRVDAHGALIATNPGYQVKYNVDTSTLTPGEHEKFLKYISQNLLHISVWDSSSLMLYGTASLPLSGLLRRGRDAVQGYCQLPVVSEHWTQHTTAHIPEISSHYVKAVLYMRLGNIGFPPVSGCAGFSNISSNQSVVTHSLQSVSSSLIRAKHMQIPDPFFVTCQRLTNISQEEAVSYEKKIKLARLKNIRNSLRLPSNYMKEISHEEHYRRELQAYKSLRLNERDKVLTSAALQSLTTVHTIFPSYGSSEFFEYKLTNPSNALLTIVANVSDPDLKFITNIDEWRYFKQAYKLRSDVEPSVLHAIQDNTLSILLKPQESIYIPIKYTPSSFKALQEDNMHEKILLEAKNAMVEVRNKLTRDLVGVLLVQVQPQPQIINALLRFYHPENSPFQKVINIKQVSGLAEKKCTVRSVSCSDKDALCELRDSLNISSSYDAVSVKTTTLSSPLVKQLDLLLYADQYCTSPIFCWRIFIHAAQKIDINTTQGTVTKFDLLLRGYDQSQLVQCFSSNPELLNIEPNGPFIVHAGVTLNAQATFTPNYAGTGVVHVTCVDTEFHKIVRNWLVCYWVKPSHVTKAFQVVTPVGSNKLINKKLLYHNGYGCERIIDVTTDRPDILHVSESRLTVAADKNATLRFKIEPSALPKMEDALVFIKDKLGNTEETYSLKIVYVLPP